ncbi:MAG: M15 family metallopeptidase, partial [Lachnospiraceae bacterium]
NTRIEEDTLEVFQELYEIEYPIEKMVLIDDYNGSDEESMTDNNSSSFNYRVIAGTTTLSNHSIGCAIDINPLYNPYVKEKDGTLIVSPVQGMPYVDRSAKNPYAIQKGDKCCEIFEKHGFTWGGDWESCKDYQHFEK